MDHAVKPPMVAVLMPVYNGEKYLREAIDSILSQTFQDFEFLIINDGSSDHSVEIIESYKDDRIILTSNETNKGLPYSLNKGIDLARGVYIARMDCDDVSLPTRLEKQVLFMETHPDIGVCGTWIQIDTGNRVKIIQRYHCDSNDIRAGILFDTPLAHPSVIIRKSVLDTNNLRYGLEFRDGAEDYDLWAKTSALTKFASIPETLVLYRMHATNMTLTKKNGNLQNSQMIRLRQLKELGLSPTEEDLRIHNALIPAEGENVLDFLEKEEVWLRSILDANTQAKIYEPSSLAKILYLRWKLLCHINAHGDVVVWKKFNSSPLFRNYKRKGVSDSARLLAACILKKYFLF